MKLIYLVLLSVETFCLPDLQVFQQNVHSPDRIHRMSLSTGDLKRFSGHALQLIQNKCPKVNSSVIFYLNKLIGKAIATEGNPVPGDDEHFRDVLKLVTTCSNEVNTLPLPKISDTSGHESAVDDFVKILLVSSFEDKASDPPITPEQSDVKGDEFKVLTSPVWKLSWAEITPAEENKEIHGGVLQNQEPIGKTAGTKDETSPSISTPTINKSAPTINKSAPSPANTATTTLKPEVPEQERSPFVEWVSSVIANVSEFFKNIFSGRQRRSTQEPLGNEMYQNETMGEKMFKRLFGQACRIYCEKCNGKLTSHQFKTASKEVLDYLFKIVPSQRLDLAASFHLTKEFMQSVEECG